jgi:hypothetical protein
MTENINDQEMIPLWVVPLISVSLRREKETVDKILGRLYNLDVLSYKIKKFRLPQNRP